MFVPQVCPSYAAFTNGCYILWWMKETFLLTKRLLSHASSLAKRCLQWKCRKASCWQVPTAWTESHLYNTGHIWREPGMEGHQDWIQPLTHSHRRCHNIGFFNSLPTRLGKKQKKELWQNLYLYSWSLPLDLAWLATPGSQGVGDVASKSMEPDISLHLYSRESGQRL